MWRNKEEIGLEGCKKKALLHCSFWNLFQPKRNKREGDFKVTELFTQTAPANDQSALFLPVRHQVSSTPLQEMMHYGSEKGEVEDSG